MPLCSITEGQPDHRQDSQAGIYAALDHPAQYIAQRAFLNIAYPAVNQIGNDAGIEQDRAGMSEDIDAPARPRGCFSSPGWWSARGKFRVTLTLTQESIDRLNQVDREGQHHQQPISHQ